MKLVKIKVGLDCILLFMITLFSGESLKLLTIYAVILLHELGHYIALKIFKVEVEELKITLLGGFLKANKENLPLVPKLIIDLSGIIVNIMLIIILKLFNANYEIVFFNYLMIIFNLFPILPLDGYQIIKDILGNIYEEEYQNYLLVIINIIGLIIMLGMIIYFKNNGLFIIYLYLLYNLIKMIIRKKVRYKEYTMFYRF